MLPWFENRERRMGAALDPRSGVCEALDPDKLERLGRYEVHLDRKLERMLAMLRPGKWRPEFLSKPTRAPAEDAAAWRHLRTFARCFIFARAAALWLLPVPQAPPILVLNTEGEGAPGPSGATRGG